MVYVMAYSASGSKLYEKGIRQRREILDVAKQTILDEGLENLVLRRLASKCSMELGNLQYYFKSRESLLEAIVVETYALDSPQAANHDKIEKLECFAERILTEWQSNGAIYQAIFAQMRKNQRFIDLNKRFYAEFYEQVITMLEQRKPDSSPQELLVKAKLVTSLMDGARLQIHSGSKQQQKVQRQEFIDAVLTTIGCIAADCY